MITRFGDPLIAAGLVTLMIVQVWLLHVSQVDKLAITAGALALLVPLAYRTRMPLTLMTLLAAVGLMGQWLPKRVLDVEAFGLIVLLVVYSAGAHTAGRRAWMGGAAAAGFVILVSLTDPDGVTFAGIIFFFLLFGAPWLAGFVVQRRRVSEARMRHERDAAEAAIVEERGRIARELHDVVAHAISVIVLQARGGRRLLDSEPDETRGALDTIEHTGQQALVEMRRLVGLLRESDEELALAPQPSLSQLDRLLAQVRAAGLPVELSIEGEPVELPPGVDLSAYRIVQEALTNTLKHAGNAHAEVTIRYCADSLELVVVDDGYGSDEGARSNGGHGLVGMQERVAMLGGSLQAGPRESGGFLVSATLPLERETA